MKESELILGGITLSVHDGGFLRIEASKHMCCGQPVEITFSQLDTDTIKQWLAAYESHNR